MAMYKERSRHTEELLARAESLLAEAEMRANKSEQRLQQARSILARVTEKNHRQQVALDERERRIKELEAELHKAVRALVSLF